MYTGLTGKVMVQVDNNNTEVAYISNWSVEDSTDIIEITELGKDSKGKKKGMESWSASADGAVSFEPNKSHSFLFTAKHSGKPVTIRFYLSAAPANPQIYYEGIGYIESLSVDLSAEDKGNISISISGSGELKLFDGTTNLYTTAQS